MSAEARGRGRASVLPASGGGAPREVMNVRGSARARACVSSAGERGWGRTTPRGRARKREAEGVRQFCQRAGVGPREKEVMKAILDHVGIAVRDLPATLAFYRDALGLDVEAPEDVAPQQ